MLSDGNIVVLTGDNYKSMRTHTHPYLLTALCAVAFLIFCPALHANAVLSTLTLSASGYVYTPTSQTVGTGGLGQVGPYTATVTDDSTHAVLFTGLVFCLDGNITGNTGKGYWTDLYDLVSATNALGHVTISGYTQTTTLKQQEEEAALLAATALSLQAHSSGDSSTQQHNVDGPIQYAIWQEMGTNTKNNVTYTDNPKAASYMQTAATTLTTDPFWSSMAYLKNVYVWIPVVNVAGTYTFSTAAQRFVTATAAPEPGTLAFLGTGVLLLALGKLRRRG
jgi:hypothetical protein